MDFPRCKGKGHLRESGIGAWVNSCTEGNPHFWEGREGKGGGGGGGGGGDFHKKKLSAKLSAKLALRVPVFGADRKKTK